MPPAVHHEMMTTTKMKHERGKEERFLMETVIGCTTKEGAKTLFSAPAISGEEFRKVVDIYACGSHPCISKIAQSYVRQLAEDGSERYIVWARSFMHGGSGPRGAANCEPPEEFFDVAMCFPVAALDEQMISEFEAIANSAGGPFGGGGRPGGPCGGRRGKHPGPGGPRR